MSESSESLTVRAVVLNYENPDLTNLAVFSVLEADPAVGVTVVDNGSSEESFVALRRLLPDSVVVERIKDNCGIPAALNHGVNAVFADPAVDAAMIVMNDVTVAEVDVQDLCRQLAMPKVAAVGPVQCRYDDPELVHTAGGRLDQRWWVTSHFLNGRDYSSVPRVLPPAEFLDFSCVAINRTAWNDVGPLLTDFRFYWDDVEWSVRARNRGWSLGINHSRCLHRVGGTMGTGVSPVALSRSAHNRWATHRLQPLRSRGLSTILAPLREVARFIVGGRDRRRVAGFELRGWWDTYVRRLGPGQFRDR